MSFKVHLRPLGALTTNCYIAGDTATGDAVIIDPADDAPKILEALHREQWTVRAILLTHAHFDHIMALRDLEDATAAPILMHRDDLPLLEGLSLQTQLFLAQEVPPVPPPDHYVEDGHIVEVGSLRLEVRFTPGHAPGHVIYVCHEQGICFSGDCVFAGSVGRTGTIPGTTLFMAITLP
jgi:glyoxylase-like metal-dependent hydrolase (beta-lactamase superfamily II)